MTHNSPIKIITGIISTILLGAIGSGLWEKVLWPAFVKLSSFTTSFLSSISESYSDSIYSKAAYIGSYNKPDMGVILLLLLLLMWLLLYSVDLKDSPLLHSIAQKIRGWLGITYSGALIIFVVFILSRESTVSNIKYYSVNNMEIIHPYISEKEYLTLRSNYFRMKNKKDFDLFLKDMYTFFDNSNIKIEEFRAK